MITAALRHLFHRLPLVIRTHAHAPGFRASPSAEPRRLKITLAEHYGMCFGVRDALRKTHDTATAGPATVLGELVHNPVVRRHLASLGIQEGNLDTIGQAPTQQVIITAHGAADRHRAAWQTAGFQVTDTTCPLVRKAHAALAQLAAAGCSPVVIGQASHVEVRGLTGDFPNALVIEAESDLNAVPYSPKFGVVSQTTQPVEKVRSLIAALQRRHPGAEVHFRDTVCQPTKDRQSALEKLCRENDLIIVVGGRNSNNTRQLVLAARRLGCQAQQVETATDLQLAWLTGVWRVGVTAGTSTLDETVRDVVDALRNLGAD